MTDEQNERAARVWREACGAYEDNSHDLTLSIRDRTIAGDQAAAAIIAADRAELVERVKVLEGDNRKALVAFTVIETLSPVWSMDVDENMERLKSVAREASAAILNPKGEA